jgi:catechol 2,3-dioxygenase-like lactoylglutathione lyase family enzyme
VRKVKTEMREQIINAESPAASERVVPKLLYDGGNVDVLYDYHEEAIKWYENYLGWRIEQKEDWKPDPKVAAGKMTHMGRGYWLTLERLPEVAVIGKVDGPVRPTCFIQNRNEFFGYHRFLKESGVDVGAMGGFTGRGMSMFHFYDTDGNHLNVSCFV